MPHTIQNMGHPVQHDGSGFLTIISGICALLSLANIQPYLTLIGSVIAIVSGAISIYKKIKRK